MVDFFNKWKEGLEKTRKVAFGRIATIFGATQITSQTWDELEAILIQADLGIETTQAVVNSLKKKMTSEGFTRSEDLQQCLHQELVNRITPPPEFDLTGLHPAVILLVGVNGSGKTTTAAKLGKQFALQGKKVLLAAADTFRAAAVDQLQVWGDRLGLPVVAGQPGSDPGAVTYDAIQSAISRKMDIVLVDTAGRLDRKSVV